MWLKHLVHNYHTQQGLWAGQSLLSPCLLLLLLNLKMSRLWTPFTVILICSLLLPLLMSTALNPFSLVIPTSPLWSLCWGLHEGFWPFANTHYGEWPLIWDNSQCTPKTSDEAIFLQEQIDKEVQLGCYFRALWPWFAARNVQHAHPAVPKPGSSKVCLITDHSTG